MSLFDMDEIRSIVDDFMQDTCEVYTISRSSINVNTGFYTETKTVRYSGRCMVVPPGGGSDGDEIYVLALPIDSAVPIRGATVRMLTAATNPDLVDKLFDVVDSVYGTFSVYRTTTMAMRAEPGE
jgi:hypothetical protein